MSTRIRTYLRQNVLGLVAIFIALSGTAYATHPGGQNTIGSADIIDAQVKEADIGQGAVASDEVKNDSILPGDVAPNSLTSGRILDATLTGVDVNDNSLKGVDIDESTLTNIGGGGPAGGDLTGAYPDPLIRENAVGSGKVADDSLTGDDINESQLDQVPSAVLGGFGRHTNTQGNCDPESETFVVCAFRTLILPAPSRVLVIARIEAFPEDTADQGSGVCRIGTSGAGPLADTAVNIVQIEDIDPSEDLSLIGVTPVLSAGTQSFGIDCNQDPSRGAIRYWEAQVAAVALSSN
jgi:hypothetical protein